MKGHSFAKLFGVILLGSLLLSCSANKSIDDDPGAAYQKYSSEQLFNMAEKALANRNYNGAIKYFQALDSLYPFNSNSELAHKEIIYAYYKMKDYASCEAAAERYIRLYPEGSSVDYAYYMKGLSQMDQNRTFLQRVLPVDIAARDLQTLQDAFYSFRDVVQTYPQSPYAKDAHARMVYLKDVLAQHEIEVAIFYYKRGAYEAAINRAHGVLTNYQGTPQMQKALQILIKANKKLGHNDAAQRAQIVLNQNF